MKPSEALKVARKIIEAEVYRHTCNALPPNKGGDTVRAYIGAALCGYATYRGWLYGHYPFIARKMSGDDEKQARIQWIDWMIEQYEGIGQ